MSSSLPRNKGGDLTQVGVLDEFDRIANNPVGSYKALETPRTVAIPVDSGDNSRESNISNSSLNTNSMGYFGQGGIDPHRNTLDVADESRNVTCNEARNSG